MMDGRYGEQFGQHEGFHWGILVMIAAVAAIAVITVLVIRALDRSRSTTAPPAPSPLASATGAGSSAAEILQTRLANGEIDVAEYRERMAALIETS